MPLTHHPDADQYYIARVRGLRIRSVEVTTTDSDNSQELPKGKIVFYDEDEPPLDVNHIFLQTHKPKGGYYLIMNHAHVMVLPPEVFTAWFDDDPIPPTFELRRPQPSSPEEPQDSGDTVGYCPECGHNP